MSNTIAQNLARLQTARTNIGNAIVERGGTVAQGDGFEDFPYAILNIPNRLIYGFTIDPSESDPYDAVTYIEDAVGMTPASMGTTSFDYGSWPNAWFMPKPCMLKYDGTVDYYLDPTDFSKKLDGTASDYNNLAYAGNVMIEFPKIWFKTFMQNGKPTFLMSNYKVDNTYHCWSNIDSQNNETDHFYLAAYNGCIYDGKLRSISGLTLASWVTTAYSASSTYAVGDKVNYRDKMYKCITAVETAEAFDESKWEQYAFSGNTDGTQEVNAATAMNQNNAVEWYIDTFVDRVLINCLLTLIGKSLDTQGTFGRGIDTGSQTGKEAYVTGSLNDKGMFYGSTANGTTAVKVFGIENWFECCWRRTAGLVGASDGFLWKLTYNNADGSTATAYNSTGSGYNKESRTKPASNYLKEVVFGNFGFLPKTTGSPATSTTYFCDYHYTGNGFAFFGGYAGYGAYAGAWCLSLTNTFGTRGWYIAAAPSCKPLGRSNV